MVVPLLVKDLRKDYLVKGKVTSALRGLSLTASRPMILSILGRNGSGKTTFVKIATGQLIPGSGTVEIFGHDVISSPASVKGLISLVPQECRPWGHMTPREHIYLYQRILGNSREGARDRVQFISDMLNIGSFMDTEAVNLSGGQRQLIVVGMSLSAEADIYFLDEPTIGLDVITRKNVWEGIRYFRKLGKTIVLTTHYLDEASALSDEIAVVSDGRLLAQGTLQQLQNMLDYNTRIRIPADFSKGGLESYGRVVSDSQYEILYTDEKRVEEIILSAGLLKTRIEIGPVGLDDVFISLVGGSIED